MAWHGLWARLTVVRALHIKSAGVAVILILIPLHWMLGIGCHCVAARVVVTVVGGRDALGVHLGGLQEWALHGGHVGLGGRLLHGGHVGHRWCCLWLLLCGRRDLRLLHCDGVLHLAHGMGYSDSV